MNTLWSCCVSENNVVTSQKQKKLFMSRLSESMKKQENQKKQQNKWFEKMNSNGVPKSLTLIGNNVTPKKRNIVDLDNTIIYDKFGEIAAESNVFMTTGDKKSTRKSGKQDIYHPVPAAFLSQLNNPEYSSKKQIKYFNQSH